MIQNINYRNTEYKTLNSFSSNKKSKNAYVSYRYHKTKENEAKESARALAGAVIGTAIPLFFFAKKQNKSFLKMHYGLKEIIGVSAGSIIGGVAGGMINSDKFDRKQKINEGVFQFMNAAIPPAVVIGLSKITSKIKPLNNNYGKIGSILVGLIGGMFAAARLSNFICDPKDKVPDRKLTIKDSLANIDDAIGTLAITDIPAFKNIPVGPLLPPIYILCGYRAGDSN